MSDSNDAERASSSGAPIPQSRGDFMPPLFPPPTTPAGVAPDPKGEEGTVPTAQSASSGREKRPKRQCQQCRAATVSYACEYSQGRGSRLFVCAMSPPCSNHAAGRSHTVGGGCSVITCLPPALLPTFHHHQPLNLTVVLRCVEAGLPCTYPAKRRRGEVTTTLPRALAPFSHSHSERADGFRYTSDLFVQKFREALDSGNMHRARAVRAM
jgi:hypothetical protein